MKKITAEKLKSGDILAKDIISGKGITILKKGTVITDKFIENIKKINADFTKDEENLIFIEDTDGVSPENALQNIEKMEKELASLEKRFERADENEFMQKIKEIIKNVIIKNYGGNI